MHILATTTASLDDLIEPIDLGHQPADMVALSFSDSDLASLNRAVQADASLPDLRLAALRDLRHPMSVDLWVDRIAASAKVIVVRVLGGYDWWRYGCDRLSETARRYNVKLALLPGECRVEDERLASLSTMEPSERQALLACFREGGPDNMRRVVERMAMLSGQERAVEEAEPLPRAGYYRPDEQTTGSPVLILFYRSMLLAEDVAPIDALADELKARGLNPVPIYVSSLRDSQVEAFLREAVAQHHPSAILTATAFASGAEPGAETLFDQFGLPVFQIVTATTRREAWESGQRGLAPADLAMHVVLPELDGRILAGAISFKEPGLLPGSAQINRPEPDRIAHVATRIANYLHLTQTPPAERKITILLPDYPGSAGRTGYAVGLDVPASVLAMLADLLAAGYTVGEVPELPRELMRDLINSRETLDVASYKRLLKELPEGAQAQLAETWGEPETDAEDDGFGFRALRFGNVTIALAPDRGRSADRRADYHDPALPPRHALVAFGFWMREIVGTHAIIHVGAHGTLEWLPGKTAALSQNCFPEIVTGALPVIYPFIVSNPGEAAQAKRRIAAVTLGHLTPPLEGAGLSPEQQELERLVDEYSQADGLDRRRRDRLAKLIVETAQKTGLAGEAGVDAADDPDAALVRIDAWLCDLKDFAVKDGLHIFGRAEGDDPMRRECGDAERTALLAALDGRHIRPGPAGAPARGRTDVLPTGRNLFTSDPRTLPTPTAFALGEKASAEVLRSYMQEHGDWPRALVIDLWGSASLRTGGEEIAQGLALMGCRPQWDPATGRVTGIEVLPPAQLGRPRIDVTWRISGLFRDMFATQIALIDAAVAAVAARDEAEGDNPLAAARRDGQVTARIFGSAPGTYGSGVEDKLASGDWDERAELGRAYLDGASHAFGGHSGEGRRDGSFADRLVEADLLVHSADDPGRDILEGSADVAFIGGFAAAVKALGGKADLIVLDTTKAETPEARSLAQTITRTVRARALNPRFIAGQLRHGPRGASEFAETVDRLVGFAETTDAVPGALIGDLHTAYLEDDTVRAFLLRENPAAARFIAERLASARSRGLWHPLRNSIDDDLSALIAEARAGEVAA
ncbi:cobaltochelatase subunit CobN [Tianweitania sp. BSSL-BM11]|uniref:Cobaltochelatase subunit CobN n=1 Tax=Tianweitania aestuarii TaxID=2814886 RepID=A0ABS5RU64_9HYPH|nr:cobaltochelatase subunit CobN [Tianweitania aestuarii]MBS9720593.1 cobaltochelatase subunit CobN [Tianweitania aestuarii]